MEWSCKLLYEVVELYLLISPGANSLTTSVKYSSSSGCTFSYLLLRFALLCTYFHVQLYVKCSMSKQWLAPLRLGIPWSHGSHAWTSELLNVWLILFCFYLFLLFQNPLVVDPATTAIPVDTSPSSQQPGHIQVCPSKHHAFMCLSGLAVAISQLRVKSTVYFLHPGLVFFYVTDFVLFHSHTKYVVDERA